MPQPNNKVYSKNKKIFIANWGKVVLQIGAAFFYYKLRKVLQIRAIITN